MIVSRFYLIKGDNKPIYVGFTNRTIKQRFAEHKSDKDFSRFNKVTIQELDRLEYAFTWDENELYKNANEVSVREAQLVEQYGTQDSPYQKAMGGGVVWTYEKWFVSTNKDNPKFLGMTSEQVEEYLEKSDIVKSYMRNFVNGIQDPVRVYIGNFVRTMNDPVKIYVGDFVHHMQDPVKRYLQDFVNGIQDPVRVHMKGFVVGIQDPVKRYLQDFVKGIEDPVKIYMRGFVRNIDDPVKVYMRSFISRIEDPVKRYMKDFINNIDDPVKVYMRSFISRIEDPVRVYMKNCVNHMNMKKKEEIK